MTIDWIVTRRSPTQAESRSKLVVRTGEEMTRLLESTQCALIDGTTLTHPMKDDDDAVTIYAVDSKTQRANPVEDTEVSFTSTTNPMGIVPASDLRMDRR